MPIVIVKESDSQRNKKKGHSKVSDLDAQYEKTAAAGLMEDVLNLKIFRVSEPNFFTGTTTTTLVGGELFYSHEENEQAKVINAAATRLGIVTIGMPVMDNHLAPPSTDNSSAPNSPSQLKDPNKQMSIPPSAAALSDGKPTKAPSLLQNFRALRYKSKKRHVGQEGEKLVHNILQEHTRTRFIKAGQSLSHHMTKKTTEETLHWVISHVTSKQDDVASLFLKLDEKIMIFESKLQQKDITDIASADPFATTSSSATNKAAKQAKSRFQNTAQSGFDATGNSANNNAVKVNLAQQLEAMKIAGTEAFLKAVTVTSSSGAGGDNDSVNISRAHSASSAASHHSDKSGLKTLLGGISKFSSAF